MEINFWTILHFSSLAGLALYGFHRAWILCQWLRIRNKPAGNFSVIKQKYFPAVTVQLPLFNERFVAERLLDAAARIDWPRDKFEIQVLDDSTDDTRGIVDGRVSFWKKQGISISVIRRDNRQGYKAGALAGGLQLSHGEFIAIFDADFVPPQDFLMKTIPAFDEKNIGMVQARWGFLNREHSLLSGIQSLLLGSHFRIEHNVRCSKGLFFNFNGTAGVWRREAIESAGGWQPDTVTEDLDLSYRAQMSGWKFRYLDSLVVPSELPVTLASFRLQQQRWAKGSVQTALKILPKLLLSRHSLAVKSEAIAHLGANFCWLLGMIVILTLYPAILSRTHIGPYQILRMDVPLFMFSSVAIFLYFVFFHYAQRNRASLISLLLIPVFSIGLAPSISLYVVEGFFSKGGIFDRTPKFGISGKGKLPRHSFLYRQKTFPYLLLNVSLFCYTLLPVFFALQRETWFAIPFLAVFPLGFLIVMIIDVSEIFGMLFPSKNASDNNRADGRNTKTAVESTVI